MVKKKKRKRWSKKERQAWWANLSDSERQQNIERWQKRKAERRAMRPPKELKYNPKYPWMTEGVHEGNREQWRAMILKKNPWLKI